MACQLPLFPRQGRGFTDNVTAVFCGENGQAIGVTARRNTPISLAQFLGVFEEEEPTGDWPYRELVGSLLCLFNQT